MLPEFLLQSSLVSLPMMRDTAVITSSLYAVVTMATIECLAFPDDLSFKIARHIFFSVSFLTSSVRLPLGYAMVIFVASMLDDFISEITTATVLNSISQFHPGEEEIDAPCLHPQDIQVNGGQSLDVLVHLNKPDL